VIRAKKICKERIWFGEALKDILTPSWSVAL